MERKMIGWPAGVLCLVAAVGAFIVGSAIASSESAKAREQGESAISQGAADARADLSMEEIVSILRKQGLGEVYEVEREWGSYEVKIRDPQGTKLKLYVDSKTGEVLRQKRDDDDQEWEHDDQERDDD